MQPTTKPNVQSTLHTKDRTSKRLSTELDRVVCNGNRPSEIRPKEILRTQNTLHTKTSKE